MDPEQCHNSKYFPHLVEQHTRLSNKANICSKYYNKKKCMGASTLDLPLYHGGGMSLLDCVSEGSNLFFLK